MLLLEFGHRRRMVTWCVIVLCGAWVPALFGATADPRRELEDALKRLTESGTYAWRESRRMETQQRPMEPFAFGRTSVGGYTFATLIEFDNARVAFLGRATALSFPDKPWRLALSLSDRDIDVLLPDFRERSSGSYQRVRRLAHAPLHEVLAALLSFCIRLQRNGSVIAGEIGTLRSHQGLVRDYLFSGGPPPGPPGIDRHDPASHRQSPANTPGSGVTFRISLEQGAIKRVEFTLSIEHPGQLAPDGTPSILRDVVVIDIVETGLPTPEPDPDVVKLLGAGR